jgi:protein-L-isoaspartate(D-aspartate) O-methyltransferase
MWRSCSKLFGKVPRDLASEDARFDADTDFADRRRERLQMVADTIRDRGVNDVRVLGALANVPRHAFVPSHLQALAYADQPLPIGDGQTISQPYIVAIMTSLAELKQGERCLEVGTGSGYQTAVLAEMGVAVFTVEIRDDLAARAQSLLLTLGYQDPPVRCKTDDGNLGWPEAAPFDAILITAAPERVPPALLEQLAVNGRLVAPIGPANGIQRLEKWTRRTAGIGADCFKHTHILNVQFVPMQCAI